MLDQSNQNQHSSDDQAREHHDGMESKKKNPGYKQPAHEHYYPNSGDKKWDPKDKKGDKLGKLGGMKEGLYQSAKSGKGGTQQGGWASPPPSPYQPNQGYNQNSGYQQQYQGYNPQGGFQGGAGMPGGGFQNQFGQNPASFQGTPGMVSGGSPQATMPSPMTGGQMGGFPGAGGAIPRERSYIENILRLNRGKRAAVYMTFENNDQWNGQIFRGIIREAGRDHIVLEDPQSGRWYLLLMIYLNYVVFDQPLNYDYPFE